MPGSQIELLGAQITRLRSLIAENPHITVEELLTGMAITPVALCNLLKSMKNDPAICCDGYFSVCSPKGPIHLKDLDLFLANHRKKAHPFPERAERLIYLYHILHNALPDGGMTFDSIRSCYEQLIGHEAETLPAPLTLKRMIYRDLEALQRMKIGIERPAEGCRKYCLRENYLPKLPPENAAMLYSTMLLFRDTLLHQAVDASRQQLEKAFFRNSPDKAKLLADRIYVLGDTLVDSEKFGDTVGKLIKAVVECCQVQMEYRNNQGIPSTRNVDPLGVVYKRSVWYLIARTDNDEACRTFRVDQIQTISVSPTQKFIYPDDFILEDYIGPSWGVYRDDPVQTVRLQFAPRVAMRVKNLCYHPSEKLVEELEDGSVIFEYQVCGLVEILSWLLPWGNAVQVLEPAELRLRLGEFAREVYELYK